MLTPTEEFLDPKVSAEEWLAGGEVWMTCRDLAMRNP
jgi:hypothetical protein